MTAEYATPAEVLEQLYREALEYADARGVSLREGVEATCPDSAAEVLAYYEREYRGSSLPWSCTPYAVDANATNRITKSVG